MESELEQFHKQNTGLDLNIAELRLKLKATEKELYQERQTVGYPYLNLINTIFSYFVNPKNSLRDTLFCL